MKHFLLTLIIVLYAPVAFSADLVCTLPDAYVTRGLELCEELRLTLNIRTSEWSNSVCASEFLRIGLLAGDRASTKRAARIAVNDAVNDTTAAFQVAWPSLVAAFCGDGTIDAEFGETCDDGNQDNGDGCDSNCQPE